MPSYFVRSVDPHSGQAGVITWTTVSIFFDPAGLPGPFVLVAVIVFTPFKMINYSFAALLFAIQGFANLAARTIALPLAGAICPARGGVITV